MTWPAAGCSAAASPPSPSPRSGSTWPSPQTERAADGRDAVSSASMPSLPLRFPRRHAGALASILLSLCSAACTRGGDGTSVPREWRDYAGGPDSSRFFPSTQISKDNVSRLQVAWSYKDGQTDFNPIVARGVVYGRGPGTSFVALDAATGRQIWVSDGVADFNARGVNYWESKDGKD